jgi:hypothetical protein
VSFESFNRTGGAGVRKPAMVAIAEILGLEEPGHAKRVVQELVVMARAGKLSDRQVGLLDSTADLMERLESIDRLWVFGNRYMRHKFVSIDPMCANCKNGIPHRTLLICPSCGKYGPWVFEERKLQSSYAHYLMTEMVNMCLDNTLILESGDRRADGLRTAMPRGGAKSTWLCEITVLWLILTGRSHCLLLLSNTTNQVVERAMEIKGELESNTRLVEDFGRNEATRQEKRKWAQDDFTIVSGARVVARGAGQSMRGVKNKHYRPDVIIGDDVDDDKFMTTSDQAQKLYEWWDQRVVPACHPNFLSFFHGTVLGEIALLWQHLTGHRGGSSQRTIIRAVEDRPGCSVCGMPAKIIGPFDCPICNVRQIAVQPSSFWGARFTVEALNALRDKIGHWAFQSEMQQEVHDDSTSWFEKSWLDEARHDDLAPLNPQQRRIIPWSIIACTLDGREMIKVASELGDQWRTRPGDHGPYQMIIQAWDPAWAREKDPKKSKNAFMAGVGMGLTWDDKIDIFWINRKRALTGTEAYREWMYEEWIEYIQTPEMVMSKPQHGMIVERNGAGVIFQYGIEEHWGSINLIDHQTGVEKHDLQDGIPGLASWFKAGKMIIRGGGSRRQKEMADELERELKSSGKGQYKDMLMATWMGWAYINRWIRDKRDVARYNELTQRRRRKSG